MMTAVADFDAFYRSTKDGCYRALLAIAGDDAADLLAEAYTRAWKRWTSLAQHPAPAAWVMRTAINLHRDRHRRQRFLRRVVRQVDHVDPPSPPVDREVLAALLALPVRQREVVALRILLDLDTAQTADLLGIAPNTVKVHLHRALSKLRSLLVLEPEEYR